MAILFSWDLLNHLQKELTPPAQLCLIRVLNTDNEYVLRVRYKDVHLDYPVSGYTLDLQGKSGAFDEMLKALVVMSKMVVPANGENDPNWNSKPEPVIMHPAADTRYYYEW